MAVALLFLGFFSAARAQAAPSSPPVHAINLHAAWERALPHVHLSSIAGVVPPRGTRRTPASTPASADAAGAAGGATSQLDSTSTTSASSCTEPNCPVTYHGGSVQHHPHVYLLLWGPDWSTNSGEEASASYLESFYDSLGPQPTDTWSAITSQYGDSSGYPTFTQKVYKGAWHDTSTPPTGVGAYGLAAEAYAFATSQGITDKADAQIIVATQSGTCPVDFGGCGTPDSKDYCAWHAAANGLPFTNLPYVLDGGVYCGEGYVNSPGTYDGWSIVAGHEYAETITDPAPWKGWVDTLDTSNKTEIGDKCAWGAGGTPSGNVMLDDRQFAMQPLWSNFAGKCVMSPPPSYTSVVSTTNPSVYGQPATFIATVIGQTTVPAGTVTFTEGTTPLATVTLNSQGKAAFTTANLEAGSHPITVSYDNADFLRSSGTLTQTVNRSPTIVTLASSANPSAYGQQVTFTATVAAGPPGTGTPAAGTVTFTDGTTTLGTATLNSQGKATLTTANLEAGSHPITANYSGDTDYAPSTGTLTQTVNRAATSTSLASSANPSAYGQQVTFTATVAAGPPGAGTPAAGTVTFTDGTTALGTATLNSDSEGKVTFTTANLEAGSHPITASYSGDTDYAPSTGTLTQTVDKAATSTSLASSANPSAYGQSVTFTATVVALPPGAGTPAGPVTFTDGTTTLGTGMLNSQGTATFTTANLATGSHSITASYNGNPNDKASTSGTVDQNVDTNLSQYLTSAGTYDLNGTNLTQAFLADANLAGANITNVNLTGADLAGADLAGANVTGTNVKSADLSGANLAGADLTNANLSGVNLSGADLAGADLTNANLKDTTLTLANFSGATGMTSAILTGAIWNATTCPDNTSSDNDGGSCLNNLNP